MRTEQTTRSRGLNVSHTFAGPRRPEENSLARPACVPTSDGTSRTAGSRWGGCCVPRRRFGEREGSRMAENGPILVTGAAGKIGAVGRTVTDLLLERGLPVRAMVRREDDRAAAFPAPRA